MVTYEEQKDLFQLIGNRLKKDLVCYAFGGTAMLFYGYKDETKDIDLLFETAQDRTMFIQALEVLGFRETIPIKIYIPEKLRDKNRPLMYQKEESRFDLFAKKIFHTVISPKMKEDLYAEHEFKGKYSLTVRALRKEHLVLLKAVTERRNDFDDIRTIIEKDKHFDWQYLIDEVLWQYQHGDSWVLLDVEKMMQELKQYLFVPEKYFQQLHAAAKSP